MTMDKTNYLSDDVSLSSPNISNIPTDSDDSFEQPRNRINIDDDKTSGHTDRKSPCFDEQWMSKSTKLTCEALLRFDLGDRMPELVANLSLSSSHPSESFTFKNMEIPFWSRDGKKVNVYVVFLATPWGLCLLATDINLSLTLENLKFLLSLLDDCLRSVESMFPEWNGALNDGQSRHDLHEMTKKLQESQHKILSSVGRIISLCKDEGHQLPHLSDLAHQSEVVVFCNQSLQRMYDQWNSLRKDGNCEDPPVQWEICLLELEFGLRSWMRDFFLNCGDIIQFVLTRKKAPLVDHGRLRSWIDE